MRILLVEDEKYISEAIAHVLKINQYIVDIESDGESGLYAGLSGIYDMIILDIMLPKLDGIHVLKELRKQKIKVPIMMLTALGETDDKVTGLDSGADDYIAKPVPTEELLARIRALGRRQQVWHQNGILKFGSVELDPHQLVLRCHNRDFRLTPKECQVLELLMNRRNTILSKDMIIEKVWGFDSEATDNHVEVYISFLRKKLHNIQADIMIQTVRRIGYILKMKGAAENV
ncbi:DNA-binding response regulator, OmpR family, contains REC and winged-helix (wHTH) domain [Seinonella peptonophila]|uniref:DNA-binding response regulator, OmpR family, contains REC and winged-helix (WHTH) domain n=1 Tax=Seinonella peptonophila TaxID=112248 RepID=A0A1M5BEP6_9BACL|nr:response regulator transcription factor [Seinonella peptonophila]SHF40875.1 DNA-binding response regulator, OmpR family, contains REC and winged-helix (wHTH) domain [Seinonella peptonophila]